MALENPTGMAQTQDLILGEFPRTLDDRFRLSLPSQTATLLLGDETECVLAKESPGCLSLWNGAEWRAKHDASVELIQSKMKAGRLAGRIHEVQQLGRLLSTRHKPVQLGGKNRLVLPDGFRQFLGVEAGGELILVGAAVCLEIWHPDRWFGHLEQQMPQYREMFDNLAN